MNILIDTNIFIYFEDFRVLDDSYTNLYQICSKFNHDLFLHPASFEDIAKDKNEERKNVSLSKLLKYNILENPPLPQANEIGNLGLKESSDNDRIDNLILYALYKNCVNLLITQDIGIIKKARKLGIDHRVMYVQQALHTFKQLHISHSVAYPTMIKKYLYELNKEDDIFNSLKIDYPEFDHWFKTVSQERRECWIHSYSEEQGIGGILIYKDENNPIVTNDDRGLRGKILKISTFKIAEYAQGLKLGELFIKTIFSYAVKNEYDFVYLTTRVDRQEYLVNLIEDFGFYNYGICSENRDGVYVKSVGLKQDENNKLSSLDFHRKFSPSILCRRDIKKFIVPIQPAYHNILFPEIEENKRLFYTHPSAGNTIKKAYLSHAKIKNIDCGDLLLFYRSHDKKAITTLAIVEKMFISTELDVILEEVAKRTVYSYEDIKKMAEKETHIILFRLVGHFEESFISNKWLIEHTSYKNCQSICSIDNTSFNKILEQGKLNYCMDEVNI